MSGQLEVRAAPAGAGGEAAAAMELFGRALGRYFAGDRDVELRLRRDDGSQLLLPMAEYFRSEAQLSAIDRLALDLCRGRVLDVGAGTGVHSLLLSQRGVEVISIDVSPVAVGIMRARGLSALEADVFDFSGGEFDTLLLLGHGLGLTGDPAGLDRFLSRARSLLRPGGCVLLDSLDVTRTEDAANLAYQARNRAASREIGEIRMRFELDGECGPWFGWLHVEPASLAHHAAVAGLECEVLRMETSGDYLARLRREDGEADG